MGNRILRISLACAAALFAGTTFFSATALAQGPRPTATPGTVSVAEPDESDPRLRMPPGYGTYGPRGESFSVCGGVKGGYRGNERQELCAKTEATFVSDAAGRCPRGSFADLGSWSCWTCPNNFRRSGHGIESEKACRRPNSDKKRDFAPARFVGPVCPENTVSFTGMGRQTECWTCPPEHSLLDDPSRPGACVKLFNYEPARKVRDADITDADCGDDAFYDVVEGGCWTCPAGHRRTVLAVDGPKACVKDIPDQRRDAQLWGKRTCAPGEFLSPRNGGECWACPDGMDRSINPLKGDRACESGGFYSWAPAEKVESLHCPSDQIFDLVTSENDKVTALVRRQTGKAPPPKPKGSLGSCWTCPPGHVRTAHAVYSDKACETLSLKWSPAPYVQPGIFGLEGGEKVAFEVLTLNRATFEAIADSMAAGMGVRREIARRDAWIDVQDAPQNSLVLKLAMLDRLDKAIKDPDKASDAEKQLLKSFSDAAARHQVFLARNALDAAKEWQRRGELFDGPGTQEPGTRKLREEFDAIFRGPPDFDAITLGTALDDTADASTVTLVEGFQMAKEEGSRASTFMEGFTDLAKQRRTRMAARARELAKPGYAGISDARKQTLIRQVGKISKTKVGVATVKGVLGAVGAATGPAFIAELAIEAAIEIAMRLVTGTIAINEVVPKLEANLREAEKGWEFRRLMGTTEGASLVLNYWATVTQGDTAPAKLDAFSRVAQGALKNIEKEYGALPATGDPNTNPVAVLPRFTIIGGGPQNCASAAGDKLSMAPCDDKSELWVSDRGRLRPLSSPDRCVAAKSETELVVRPCLDKDVLKPEESWSLERGMIMSPLARCWRADGATIGAAKCAGTDPGLIWTAKEKR